MKKKIDQYDIKRQEKSAKQHGRGWWWFSGTAFRSHRERTWIEQFRTEEFKNKDKKWTKKVKKH